MTADARRGMTREVGLPSADPSHVHGYMVRELGPQAAIGYCLGCASRLEMIQWYEDNS